MKGDIRMEDTYMDKYLELQHAIQDGSSVDEAIQNILDIDAASLREQIRTASKTYRETLEKYEGWPSEKAVLDAIFESSGGDLAIQFRKTSDLKRMLSLNNIQLTEDVLREQGDNPEQMKEAIEQAYVEEQLMANEATAEELNALQNELIQVLPNDDQGLLEVLLQDLPSEQAEALRKNLQTPGEMSQEQEDNAVLLAAVMMDQNEDISSEDAANASVLLTYQKCMNLMDFLDFVDKKILSVLFGISAGLIVSGVILRKLGVSALSSSLINLGVPLMYPVFALSIAVIAAKLLVRFYPQLHEKVQPLLDKVRPFVRHTVQKAKHAVLSLCGVITDGVFRPAIYWVSNTAIPFLQQNIVYPLKRRIQAMRNWFGQVKDWLLWFIEDAQVNRTPATDVNPDNESEEEMMTFGEKEKQDNWTFA